MCETAGGKVGGGRESTSSGTKYEVLSAGQRPADCSCSQEQNRRTSWGTAEHWLSGSGAKQIHCWFPRFCRTKALSCSVVPINCLHRRDAFAVCSDLKRYLGMVLVLSLFRWEEWVRLQREQQITSGLWCGGIVRSLKVMIYWNCWCAETWWDFMCWTAWIWTVCLVPCVSGYIIHDVTEPLYSAVRTSVHRRIKLHWAGKRFYWFMNPPSPLVGCWRLLY